jgi:uncharacterized protein
MASLKQISKSLFWSGLLFGAVICLPAAEAADKAMAEAAETLQCQSHITTKGSGEVTVSPDSFRLSVGVEVRDKLLQTARHEVNTKMDQILRELKAEGIPGLSLRTAILQINPVHEERSAPPTVIEVEATTPPAIIGYTVTNEVSVAVLEGTPAALGEYASRIIDAALRSGANRIGNVDFFLQDQAAAQDSALRAAVEDATRKAQAIASASGVRIVRLQTVEEGFGAFEHSIQAGPEMAMPVGGAPTPIESGNIVVSSSVTARFVFAK